MLGYSPTSTRPISSLPDQVQRAGTAVGSETPNTTVQTSLVINLASSITGDINFIWMSANGAGGVDPAPTTPSGWTLIGTNSDGSGPPAQAWLWWAPAGTSGTTNFSVGTNACAVSWAYSGLNTTTPYRAASTSIGVQTGTGTAKDTDIVTSVGSWIVSGFADRNGGGYSAYADTFIVERNHVSSAAVWVQDSNVPVAAGSQQRTATGPSTGAGVDFIMELAPAGGGGNNYSSSLSGALSFAGSLPKRTGKSLRSFLTTQNIINDRDTASFEGGTVGLWVGNTLANAATLTNSTVRSSYGERSMLITWPTATIGTTQAKSTFSFSSLAGHTYKMTARVWVPTGSVPVAAQIYPSGTGTSSVLNDTWEDISYTAVISTTGLMSLVILPSLGPTTGHQVYVDHVRVEDVTGGLTKQIRKTLSASLSFVGSFFRLINKPLAGALSFTGALTNAKLFLRSLSGSLSFNGSGYAATVLADTPAGYWRMGESSGTTMVDSSGNGRDGGYGATVSLGTTGLQSSDANTAITVPTGGSSGIEVAYGSWLSTGNAFSAELFLKYDSAFVTGNRTFMAIYNGFLASSARFIFRGESGVPTFYVSDGSSFSSVAGSTTLAHSTTYHVVATYDGSVATIYVDGVQDGTSTLGITPNAGSENLTIHSRLFVGDPFGGVMDEAAYYNYALSPTQVAAHYAARSGSPNISLAKRTNKVISAALSFTGAVAKRTSRALSGALSFTGSAAKRTSKIFGGVLSFIGSHTPTFIAGGPILKALSGSLSFTGSQTKRAGKSLAGAISFVGSDAFRTSKGLAGVLTFTGGVTKRTSRALNGSLSFVGATAKRAGKALAGSLSFAGSMAKRTTRSLSGALSFVGSVAKRTSRSLAGSLSFSGAVSYASIFLRSLSAALSFTGSQVKRTSKPLAAGVSFVGSQAKRTTRNLSGAVTFVGTTTKRTFRSLAGSLSFVGSLVSSNTFIRALSGSLSFAGSTVKRTSRSLAGGLSFVGSTARQLTLVRALSASLSFVGSTAKQTTRSLSGGLSFVGSVTKRTARSLAGGLSFVGSSTRSAARSLAGSLSFTGSVTKRTNRALAGALSFTGSVTKQTRRALAAVLSFAGGLASVLNGGAQNFTQNLSASLSFVGTTTKKTSRSLSAAISFVGATAKRTARSLAGSVSFAGTVTNIKIFLRSLSGSLSFVGSQTKRTSKSLAGSLAFTGTQVKRIFSGLGSSFTNLVYNPSFETGTGTTNANFTVPGWRVGSVGAGSVVSVQTTNVVHGTQGIQIAIDASNTNQGVLPLGSWICKPSTTYTFSFWAMSDVAGALQSQFSDGTTNFVQADGVTWNSTSTFQAYSTTTSMTRFNFTFTTAPGQTVLQLADFKRSGSGSQASKTFYVDAFQVVEGSNIIPFVAVNTPSSVLSFIGLTTKSLRRTVSAVLSFTGSFSKRAGKSLAGALGFTGSQIKRVGKGISAALSFAGTTTKRTARSLSASLSFTGAHTAGRIFLKAFNATLTFTGNVVGGVIGGGARIVGRISSAIGNRRRTKATGRGMISDVSGGPGESTVDGSSTKSTVIK